MLSCVFIVVNGSMVFESRDLASLRRFQGIKVRGFSYALDEERSCLALDHKVLVVLHHVTWVAPASIGGLHVTRPSDRYSTYLRGSIHCANSCGLHVYACKMVRILVKTTVNPMLS